MLCIHSHEGPWTANTGNSFYGGYQMNAEFEATYGGDYLRRWGHANNWPPSVQTAVAIRAWFTRGYSPWPNTSRMCGLR
jgi:hypothetical protein